MRKMARSLALGIVGIAVLVPVPVWAQVAGATLSGNVTDSSGALVSQARVSVKNVATGIKTTVASDAMGFYSVPNLLPGTYEMSASAPGFSTEVRSGIKLTVGAQQTLNFTLRVGATTEKVEVTGGAPAIELTTSSVGAVVDSETVVELPLNGRDWTQLATLQPGVVAIRNQLATTGSSNRGIRGFGSELSAGGHRPYENSYRVNGVNTNDYSNGAPGSPIGVNLGVDAIAEFSVLVTNYSAEYGRTSGAVVNAITKSGSNAFHGVASWFLRDEDFDARRYFDYLPPPLRLPPFHRNQFGVAGGGPIKKDKTFVFFDYEGIRQAKGISVSDVVPSAAARSGNLCSVPNGKCSPSTITVNSLVTPFLGLWPLPNAGLPAGGNGDTGIFNGFGNLTYSENYETLRIDHKISEKDSLAASWFYDNGSLDQPDQLLDALHALAIARQMASFEETHLAGSNFFNTVRLGYNRSRGHVQQPVKALVPAAADPALSAIPGQLAPIMVVPGLNPSSNTGALGSPAESDIIMNTYQVYDDAFVTRGKHSIKLGFAFEHIQANDIAYGKRNGSFSFGSLTSFLLDQPSSVLLTNPHFSNYVNVRQTLYGGYLQDDWRAAKNLTLNLGLRYEPVTLPIEAHDRFQVITNLFSGGVTPVHNLWASNQTLRNFQPRVGFSWDPFHDGKTAVRSAFGIFDVLPLPWEYLATTASSLPFSETSGASNLPTGSFPTGAYELAIANPSPATALTSRFVEQNPRRNYAMNWNLSVQQEITQTLMAMVGYIGSHTVHQNFANDDVNMVLPQSTPSGYLWPVPIGSGKEFNPNVGPIKASFWDGTASYEALQATVKKSMKHGIQAQASYTWGKCLDAGTTGSQSDPFQNSLTFLNPFVPQSRRGPCDFQISQNFVVNYIWQLPNPKVGSEVSQLILGGWQVGGVFTASTGTPFTLVIAGDPLGQNNTGPLDYPDRVPGCNPVNQNFKSQGLAYLNPNCFTLPTAPASLAALCRPFTSVPNTCANLFGNSGRNQISGPGLVDFDFSV